MKKIFKFLIYSIIGLCLIGYFLGDNKENDLADSKIKMRMYLEEEAKKVLKYPETYDYKSFYSELKGDTLTGSLSYTAKNSFGVPVSRDAKVWVILTDSIIDASKPSGDITHSEN